jgi:F-type H+-transporting ATPase subunit b
MTIFAFAENAIQLVPDGTLLIHLFIVVVMVAVLNRTLFRPINRVLAEREEQTSGRLNEAKKLQGEIQAGLSKYERARQEARSNAYRLIEKERARALSQREESLSQVREEISRWVAKERSEIEDQVNEARAALDAESNQTAVQISSQILHRSV